MSKTFFYQNHSTHNLFTYRLLYSLIERQRSSSYGSVLKLVTKTRILPCFIHYQAQLQHKIANLINRIKQKNLDIDVEVFLFYSKSVHNLFFFKLLPNMESTRLQFQEIKTWCQRIKQYSSGAGFGNAAQQSLPQLVEHTVGCSSRS